MRQSPKTALMHSTLSLLSFSPSNTDFDAFDEGDYLVDGGSKKVLYIPADKNDLLLQHEQERGGGCGWRMHRNSRICVQSGQEELRRQSQASSTASAGGGEGEGLYRGSSYLKTTATGAYIQWKFLKSPTFLISQQLDEPFLLVSHYLIHTG